MVPDISELLLDLTTFVYYLLAEGGYCTREEALQTIQGINEEYELCPNIEIIDLGVIDSATVEDFLE